MDNRAVFILHMLSGAFEIYFLFVFFDLFLQPRFSKWVHYMSQAIVIILYPLLAYSLVGIQQIENPIFILIGLYGFIAFYGKVFYKNKLLNFESPSIPSIAIAYYAYNIILGGITASLAVFMFTGDTTLATVGTEASTHHIALDIVLIRVPVLAMYLFIKKRRDNLKISNKFYLYIVCALAFVLVIILFPLYTSLAYGEGLLYSVAFLFATLLMGLFIFIVISVLHHRITLGDKEAHLNLIRLRNELLNENLIEAKLLYQLHGKLAHDIRAHLDVIYSLAKEEGSEKLCTYIESIHAPFIHTTSMVKSGDEYLSTILTVKKQQARSLGIAMDIDCDINPPLDIDPMDLTAIFSNLLQNAIEACEKIQPPKERYIEVYIKSQGEFISIRIENTVDGELMKQNKNMQTTKADKKMHGIGLQSVRSSVERYEGNIIFEHRHDTFVVSILLCL